MANKGNWEFSFYQKNHDPNIEANIKLSMKLENSFNPKYIHSYINKTISKEENILIKKQNSIKLNSKDDIILKNYLLKNNELLKNDLLNIQKNGILAEPITQDGKIHLLFKILEQHLLKEITQNNNEYVASIYFKLKDFNINDSIKNEYKILIEKMNNIINNLDLIQLQFNKFHSNMPPLNNKGFVKLDEWQIQVIHNIDNNISTVINAPTSAGKSVLSAYTTTKGNILFVVPTDALVWQMSSYIGNILNTNIPILTETYQTIPNRNEMITLLNNSSAIVGTPNIIVDFLPFINNNFKWIVFDEVHMIGKEEGYAMEYIMKLLSHVNFLALSATISNTDEIIDWIKKIKNPECKIDKIICNKRFFNLQKYYYSEINNEFIYLHPLALINEDDIRTKNILKKSLNPTPPDCWNLAIKLKNKFNLDDLDPYEYFKNNSRIELDEVNIYFNKLIIFLVNIYNSNSLNIMNIINSYKHEELLSSEVDLIKLAFKLKKENKTPTIIFQKNTNLCLILVREFAKKIQFLENEKYPKLFQDRLKQNKNIKKKIDTNNTSNKSMKQLLGHVQLKKDKYTSSIGNSIDIEDTDMISLQEPHEDFIFNNNLFFSEGIVEEWVNTLKKYFPNEGFYYHFMIKLLWRGVGVYTKNLPDPYLRLVQILACKKQLSIVFSDMSLVFGVSMPFRSVVVLKDNDLDTMLFHQMAGRAGRRGLDKEGNIIFAGFSWNKIKELSISNSPEIKGMYKKIYTIEHACKLNNKYNWSLLYSNILNNDINKEDELNFLYNIKTNFNNSWSFGLVNDNNHLFLNWKLRYNQECLIISFLIPYLRRGFESLDHIQEVNQIAIAHFLCNFISTYETDIENNILIHSKLLETYPYNTLLLQLEELQIIIPDKIDNKIFLSIQNNFLVNNAKLFEFGNTILILQHYCYHSKILGLSRLLGKLLTRIWWICHLSSPIMKSLKEFE